MENQQQALHKNQVDHTDQVTIETPTDSDDQPYTTDPPSLELSIDSLPDYFPDALPIIEAKIIPIIIQLNGGLREYFIHRLIDKLKVKRRVITEEINLAEHAMLHNDPGQTDEEYDENVEPDPEVVQLAEEISLDPMLIKKRIDLIGRLGVTRERRNIGLYLTVMDSRLLPMGSGSSEALAIKNSGIFGAGKSYPLSMCLKIYPKSAYHLITGGSPKSLYNMRDGLKHKALILAEALYLETGKTGDSELAYCVRSLLSEGCLKYQYTAFDGDGNKITRVQKLDGPTSLLTTTVNGRLESQLEDRLITIHPDDSSKQTRDILSRASEQASGDFEQVDEKELEAWKHFHKSLEPIEVVIPYAGRISDHVKLSGSLPVSVRRAYKRVLSAIKTIALVHQCQRQKDDRDRIIAEISDYAIAFQLVNESFMERIGQVKTYTDRRIRVIQKTGLIAMKDLATMENVSGAALTPWVKERVEKGILVWCDERGLEFPDTRGLEKAKRSGKAFIRVSYSGGLPTPFELTGDPEWSEGGELYQIYDLGLDLDRGKAEEDADLGDGNKVFGYGVNTDEGTEELENGRHLDESAEGVKVLNLNTEDREEDSLREWENEYQVNAYSVEELYGDFEKGLESVSRKHPPRGVLQI